MRGWLVGGVIAVLFAWLVATSALLTVPASRQFSRPEARFVPPAGTADRVMIGGTPGTAASVEQALFTGSNVVGEMPPMVINLMRPPQDVSRGEMRWWRETLSPNTPEFSPRMTLRGVIAEGLRLYAHTGPRGAVFRPGLLELPVDASPGASWSSSGRLYDHRGTTDYRNESSAAAPADPGLADRGCLVVTSVTTARSTPRTDVATWCPAQGVVDGQPTLGEGRRPAAPDRWPGVRRAEPAVAWPTRGVTERPEVTDGDPTFGTRPAVISLAQRQAGGVTSGGTLVTLMTGTTVRGWLPRGEELTGVWWGTPGGTILSLTILDNIVVVTTSERTVVAYDQNGRRLWSNRTPDLAPGGVAGLGRDRIVLTTVTGDLAAHDIASGDRLWLSRFTGGSDRAPVVVDERVLVWTQGGTWTAFDADGTRQWVSDELIGAIGIVGSGDTLLSLSAAGQAVRLDAGSGQIRRTEVFALGARHQRLVSGPGGTAAVVSADGVRLVAIESGQLLGFIPGASAVVAEADGWRVLTSDALVRFDPRGAELERLVLTPSVARASDMVPMPEVLWLLDRQGVTWVR